MYIPGIEGSDGITTLGLSMSRRLLAVCEKADRAVCSIYDLTGISNMVPQPPKRKKVLTSHDCNSREFVSACFSPHSEKTILATLSSPYQLKDELGQVTGMAGDSKVILWVWEKAKCFSAATLSYSDTVMPNQVSFSSLDANVVVVTGCDFYRFFRV